MDNNILKNIINLNFTNEYIKHYLLKHAFNNLHELFQRIDNNETIGTEILDILSHFNSVVFQIERESNRIDYISATPDAHDITIVLQFASGHWTPKYKYNNKTIEGPNNCVLTSLVQSNYSILNTDITREHLKQIVLILIEKFHNIN